MPQPFLAVTRDIFNESTGDFTIVGVKVQPEYFRADRSISNNILQLND